MNSKAHTEAAANIIAEKEKAEKKHKKLKRQKPMHNFFQVKKKKDNANDEEDNTSKRVDVDLTVGTEVQILR